MEDNEIVRSPLQPPTYSLPTAFFSQFFKKVKREEAEEYLRVNFHFFTDDCRVASKNAFKSAYGKAFEAPVLGFADNSRLIEENKAKDDEIKSLRAKLAEALNGGHSETLKAGKAGKTGSGPKKGSAPGKKASQMSKEEKAESATFMDVDEEGL